MEKLDRLDMAGLWGLLGSWAGRLGLGRLTHGLGVDRAAHGLGWSRNCYYRRGRWSLDREEGMARIGNSSWLGWVGMDCEVPVYSGLAADDEGSKPKVVGRFEVPV